MYITINKWLIMLTGLLEPVDDESRRLRSDAIPASLLWLPAGIIIMQSFLGNLNNSLLEITILTSMIRQMSMDANCSTFLSHTTSHNAPRQLIDSATCTQHSRHSASHRDCHISDYHSFFDDFDFIDVDCQPLSNSRSLDVNAQTPLFRFIVDMLYKLYKNPQQIVRDLVMDLFTLTANSKAAGRRWRCNHSTINTRRNNHYSVKWNVTARRCLHVCRTANQGRGNWSGSIDVFWCVREVSPDILSSGVSGTCMSLSHGVQLWRPRAPWHLSRSNSHLSRCRRWNSAPTTLQRS